MDELLRHPRATLLAVASHLLHLLQRAARLHVRALDDVTQMLLLLEQVVAGVEALLRLLQLHLHLLQLRLEHARVRLLQAVARDAEALLPPPDGVRHLASRPEQPARVINTDECTVYKSHSASMMSQHYFRSSDCTHLIPTSLRSASDSVRKTGRSTSCSSNTLKYLDRFNSASSVARSDGLDDVTAASLGGGANAGVEFCGSVRGATLCFGASRSRVGGCAGAALLRVGCDDVTSDVR